MKTNTVIENGLHVLLRINEFGEVEILRLLENQSKHRSNQKMELMVLRKCSFSFTHCARMMVIE